MNKKMHLRLMRLSEVLDLYPVSRSTLYKQIKRGISPRPIQISDKSIAWIESEIDQILLAKIQGCDAEEIRQLVMVLVNGRNSA